MSRWFDAFLRAAVARVHPAVREWLGDARIERNCREELAGVFDEMARPAEGGASAPAVIELAGPFAGHAAIVRRKMRLKNMTDSVGRLSGMREALFAAVLHTTFDIDEPGALAALLRMTPERVAGAEDVRVFRPSGRTIDFETLASAADVMPSRIEHGRRLLAAPVEEIAALPDPPNMERVTVKPVRDMSFYEEYEHRYRSLPEERPEIAPHIPIESRNAVARYLFQGLLFHIVVDGVRAGVMAADRALLAGMHGYRVQEKFIYPEFRGKGLAAAAQRRFIQALDASDDAILFGYIHPRNVWSLKAAAHDGRVDVGGQHFIGAAGNRP